MKKITSLILSFILLLSFASCGTEKTKDDIDTSVSSAVDNVESIDEANDNEVVSVPEEESNTEVLDISSYEVKYPITVTDQAGREITIEKEPESLVSGYYISSSLLIALGLDDKMVGIEAKAGKRPIYKLAAKELIDLPSVGSAKEFDLEGCAALNADLVILPLKLKDAAATLEELGIQTILVNPESYELLFEMIDIISTATNTLYKAEELKNFIASTQNTLSEKLKNAELKNVYLAGNSNVLSTAGKKMYQNGMIELAGGSNVAAEIEDKYWVDVDYEQVLAWNPDYIIIAAEADYDIDDVLNDEALTECSAVKDKNVYKLPSDAEAWDSPVPSGILGSVWLAGILHSDVISSEESDSIIKDFYETFYEFTYGK